MKIFASMRIEDLLGMNEILRTILDMYNMGMISGSQIKVCHPVMTPLLTDDTLPRFLAILPNRFKVLVHVGGGKAGVDLGECLDHHVIFEKEGWTRGFDWGDWNRETIEWALEVARVAESDWPVVLHPGYMPRVHYSEGSVGVAQRLAIKTIKAVRAASGDYGSGRLAFETLRLIKRAVRPDRQEVEYTAFGSTPKGMAAFIRTLGEKHNCLLDFTHITGTSQEKNISPRLWLDELLEEYLKLPHSSICHFSGIPRPEKNSGHPGFLKDQSPSQPIKVALKKMDAVVLEIAYGDEAKAVKEIEKFKELYL